MNEVARRRENGHDSTVRRGLIGLDADDGVHELDPETRTVHVRGHDGVEHVEALGERDIEEWIAYVDGRRGWADLRYTSTPFGDVVEAAARALEEGTA